MPEVCITISAMSHCIHGILQSADGVDFWQRCFQGSVSWMLNGKRKVVGVHAFERGLSVGRGGGYPAKLQQDMGV